MKSFQVKIDTSQLNKGDVIYVTRDEQGEVSVTAVGIDGVRVELVNSKDDSNG